MRCTGALRTGIASGGALAGPWVRNELWRRARAMPSLDLQFAENKSLVDATTGAQLVTFTRASSGTYVDSQGVIRTATTNLLLRSEEFNNAYWSAVNSSISATDSAVSPTGTITAETWTINSASGQHYFQAASGDSVASGLAYTRSLFVKKINRRYLQGGLSTGAFGANVWATFDLDTGTVTNSGNAGTYSITNFGNGWYRIAVTGTATATSTTAGNWFGFVDDANLGVRLPTFTGNGSDAFYVWGAQLEQSSTVGEYIPTTSTINSAPRFDHNPTTGESLGLLVEESRTNSIRNNTMVGAVAGTPGTLPTNWGLSGGGLGTLTQQVVGNGTINGITYVDVRFSGTTSTTGFELRLETVNGIAASNGQTWTFSTYTAVVGGSLSNISSIGVNANLSDASTAFLASLAFNVSLNTTSSLSRSTGTATIATANTAFIRPLIFFAFSSGVAIDITLRIGLPQLEQGAFATSVIPTTGTAATRSADVATDTTRGAALRTLYGQFRSPASGTRPIVSLDDNSANNRIELFTSGTDPKLLITSGGTAQADLDAGSVTANTMTNLVGRFATDNFAASVSGGNEVTDTSGTLPAADRIRIGRDQAGNYLNGTIARITGWNDPLLMLPSVSR